MVKKMAFSSGSVYKVKTLVHSALRIKHKGLTLSFFSTALAKMASFNALDI